MTKEYKIIHYFDVWGNSKDGYEVNNSCLHNESAFVTEEEGDNFALCIQDALKKADFFHKKVNRRQWCIDWNCSDKDHIEIETRKGIPLCRLESIGD
ncbi:MAG: hypothetical protein HGA25_10795 [Clostridiales bacterium]|nr:hypothetical protein [Clostridiales bacterium]